MKRFFMFLLASISMFACSKVDTKNVEANLMLEKVADRDFSGVETYIKNGSNINAKNRDGMTIMMYASVYGNIDVLKYLIANKADINLEDNNGRTALMWSAKSTHTDLEFVKYLLDNGADLKGMTIIEWASVGLLEKVKESTGNGADINQKNVNGWTPLIASIFRDHLDIIKFLVKIDVDLNIEENRGLTGLMIASERGNLEIVKILVENGVDINYQNKDGSTALSRSLVHVRQYPDVVKFLVDNGADLSIKNKNGKTVLEVEKDNGHTEVVEFLESLNK